MSLQWAYLQPLTAGVGGSVTTAPIPLDTAGVETRYDVRGWSIVSFQAVFSPGASSGILTVYRSLDGTSVGPATSAQELTTTNTMQDTLDVIGIGYLIVRVTTAESGKTVNLYVMAVNPILP